MERQYPLLTWCAASSILERATNIPYPNQHAHATENLLSFLKPGSRVLDVGSGSGYICAIFHHLVSPSPNATDPYDSDPSLPPSASQTRSQTPTTIPRTQGKVIGIDHITQLVEWSRNNLRNDGLGAALERGEIEMIVGDGRMGYPAEGESISSFSLTLVTLTLPEPFRPL